MDYSSPLALAVRGLGQRFGLLRPLVRLYRRMLNPRYEEAFDRALLGAIRPGDCVWDVGANVGLFTVKFAGLVGPGGRVVAFEPSPGSVPLLKAATASCPQVLISEAALADFDGEASFSTSDESFSDSLTKAGASAERVQVRRGDTLAAEFPPAVIKIDVEGFEPDVLRGMTEMLNDPTLRGVFIEVHFLELAKRGLQQAPAEISNILTRAGFRVQWTDPSHLAATRP